MEPRSGFEPETPSLPWKCSTTELSRHEIGGDDRTRTDHLGNANAALYQMSYVPIATSITQSRQK